MFSSAKILAPSRTLSISPSKPHPYTADKGSRSAGVYRAAGVRHDTRGVLQPGGLVDRVGNVVGRRNIGRVEKILDLEVYPKVPGVIASLALKS